jgi:prevent-host-death family protein
MAQVNIHEAKTHFSKLVERAESGEEIVIARSGKPVAVLAPLREKPKEPRKLGGWEGRVWIADDFDELTPEIAEMFGIDVP